jgi:hypothetical protein
VRAHDVYEYLAARPALAPLALQIGESETAFIERAKAHARARAADLNAYLQGSGFHPGRRPGEGPPSPDRDAFVSAPREADLHAEWWARHHVNGESPEQIAGVRDVSAINKGIKKIGAFYVTI